jgi:hypothetical protein
MQNKENMTMANEKEDLVQKIINRCAEDEEFRNRLMADPNAVLSAEGVVVPDGVTVEVLQDTDRLKNLIAPQGVLSDDDLCSVAGGSDPLVPIKIKAGC